MPHSSTPRYSATTAPAPASPFVAGLAALGYTSPNISDLNGNGFINDEIKYAIESSCKDTGVDVKYGRINAYNAVTTAIPSLGFISGTVMDDLTDKPVYPTYGCSIKAGTREATSAADGSYTLTDVPAGNYTATASTPGYMPTSSGIVVLSGKTATQNFMLPVGTSKLNKAPYQPSTPCPEDGATAASVDSNLSWNGGDPDTGDAVAYHVHFGTSASPPLVSEGQAATSYDPGMLEHDTQYFWRVVSRDSSGATTEGPLWAFTTESSPPPSTDFLATPLAGDEPLVVGFTDASVSHDGVTSWTWDFGDGTTSNDQDPIHTYAQDGVYSVGLTVAEADVRSSTIARTDYIIVLDSRPQADFSSVLFGESKPLTISFADLSTSHDGIVCWLWDFGDGTTSQVRDPEYTYAGEGVYSVTLTVTEADGSVGAVTRQVKAAVPGVDVTVLAGGEPLEGHLVYVYTADGVYATSKFTDASGQANFALLDGDYKFRVYYDGSYWWSQVVSAPGTVTMTIG
jgi:PKD repeat protein